MTSHYQNVGRVRRAIKCKTNASNGCHSLLSTQAEDGTNEGVTLKNSFDVLTSTGYIRVSFDCSETITLETLRFNNDGVMECIFTL